MANFCTHCGAELKNGQKFCTVCGASISPRVVDSSSIKSVKSQKKQHISTIKTVASTAGQVFGGSTTAAGASGEFMLSGSAAGSLFGGTGAAILSPIKVITEGFKNIKAGFQSAMKDKKKLIPAIILALVWLIATLLPALGVNPFPIKVLSFLSFAQGGMSNNVSKILGGIIGKTVFATFVFALLRGGNPLNKIKGYFANFKETIKTKDTFKIPVMLLGISLSMIAFNFMVGAATPWSFMAGLATVSLSLRALGGGFLRKLLTSIFAKFSKAKAVAISKHFISGMTIGFTLSTAMGFIKVSDSTGLVNFRQAPRVLGIFLLIISGVLLLIAFVKANQTSKSKEAVK